MNSNTNSENYILSPDSIKAYRYAVYFESEWLWKEKRFGVSSKCGAETCGVDG